MGGKFSSIVDPENDVLREEAEFFEEHRKEWFNTDAFRYALVRGRRLYGIYDTPDEAYSVGFGLFGFEPMLIRQILEKELIYMNPAMYAGVLNSFQI